MHLKPHFEARWRIEVHWAVVFAVGLRKSLIYIRVFSTDIGLDAGVRLRGIKNGEKLVKVRTAHVGHRAWVGGVGVFEDGAEVSGIASKEVAMHVVQRVFDLSVEDISKYIENGRETSSPGT